MRELLALFLASLFDWEAEAAETRAERNNLSLVREQRKRQRYTSTICVALFAQACWHGAFNGEKFNVI